MGLAFNVMLLVVAVVVALVGVGAMLALRMSRRAPRRKRARAAAVPARQSPKRIVATPPARAAGAARSTTGPAAGASRAGGAGGAAGAAIASATPEPAPPSMANRIAALQAMLDAGDARNEGAQVRKKGRSPEAEQDDYATTQFIEPPPSPDQPPNLLNLDLPSAKPPTKR